MSAKVFQRFLSSGGPLSSLLHCGGGVQSSVPQLFHRYCAPIISEIVDVRDDAHYREELHSAKEAKRLVVLNFTAEWCMPCKLMAPALEAKSVERKDIRFLRLDLDSQPLASIIKSFQIASVPTFTFIKEGKVVDSFVGASAKMLDDYITEWGDK
ncbi:hypothetical protein BSKO_07507 [Bryopsis sp. KO-2023]|nr:hypothetical protein BSKO_07507 [Bryopsis sp. KO-2023]